VLHLVTLGDSLAYGTGDESGTGLAQRIERALRQRGVAVDAVNLGVNGAQTTDVLARVRQARVRDALARADVIVLSVGANDLFRTQQGRQEALAAPLTVARRILDRIAAIVTELHAIRDRAGILILGGYNPVPQHAWAMMIEHYLTAWDTSLRERFRGDERVSMVPLHDLVLPTRLSRLDSFHPGAGAYEALAKRIAEVIATKQAAA
jgi:lysophospholipase L1-like esterase